jgi:hypothetical protein
VSAREIHNINLFRRGTQVGRKGDTTDELRALLVQAGFRTVRVSADVRMVRFASPAALVRHQVAGSPLAPHVAAVDDTIRDTLIREVTAEMQCYQNDDGLAFPIEGHIAVAHRNLGALYGSGNHEGSRNGPTTRFRPRLLRAPIEL